MIFQLSGCWNRQRTPHLQKFCCSASLHAGWWKSQSFPFAQPYRPHCPERRSGLQAVGWSKGHPIPSLPKLHIPREYLEHMLSGWLAEFWGAATDDPVASVLRLSPSSVSECPSNVSVDHVSSTSVASSFNRFTSCWAGHSWRIHISSMTVSVWVAVCIMANCLRALGILAQCQQSTTGIWALRNILCSRELVCFSWISLVRAPICGTETLGGSFMTT